jgi:hypothetical protein
LGRRHRDRVSEAEAVELGGERHVAHAVDLVRRHHHRQRAASQQVGHLVVSGA